MQIWRDACSSRPHSPDGPAVQPSNPWVQVLLPIRQGETGVQGINAVLQNMLNPRGDDKPQLERGGRFLRVGDRVMQNRNDYQRDIFNGDVGFVVAAADGALTVHYPPLQRKQGAPDKHVGCSG